MPRPSRPRHAVPRPPAFATPVNQNTGTYSDRALKKSHVTAIVFQKIFPAVPRIEALRPFGIERRIILLQLPLRPNASAKTEIPLPLQSVLRSTKHISLVVLVFTVLVSITSNAASRRYLHFKITLTPIDTLQRCPGSWLCP